MWLRGNLTPAQDSWRFSAFFAPLRFPFQRKDAETAEGCGLFQAGAAWGVAHAEAARRIQALE